MAIENVKLGSGRDLTERVGSLIADANAAGAKAEARQVRNGVDDVIEAYASMPRAQQHVPLRPGEEPTPSSHEQLLTRAGAIQATRKAGAERARQEHVKAWYDKLSDKALDKFEARIAEARARRNPEPEVDTGFESVAEYGTADDESVFEYGRPSIESGYDPVAGFRYPDGTEDVYEYDDDEGDDDEDFWPGDAA